MKLKYLYLLLVLMLSGVGSAMAGEHAGRIAWYESVTISTPVSGVVEHIPVTVSSQVKKGQLLLKLDQREFVAQVKRAQGIVVRAKEAYEEAKRELERAEELFARTAISVHDRQVVRIAYTQARASLDEAEAELTLARVHQEVSQMRAPFAGVVVAVHVAAGEAVVNRCQAVALMQVASTDQLLANTQVKASVLEGINVGDRVSVRVGNQQLEAFVHAVGYEPTQDNNDMYSLQVRFNPASTLRVGQVATIILP